MKAGLFLMPSHPPERAPIEALRWDLDVISQADKLGFSEAWVGEHFTAPWEPVPAPDLLIAQALTRTENIKLGTGAHLLPFHHPVELAHRVAYLDHMAQGRFMFGIGSGGLPTDHEMFNVNMEAGQHREMTRESLDIILNIWEHPDGPFHYEGKYWNFNIPDPKNTEFANLRTFMTPFQKPHPPIGVAAASPGSETLKIAGERGYIPMSLGLNAVYVASHWDAVEKGAADAGRPAPSRGDWRIVRDVWIADTDEEALDGALNSMQGRVWREYLHPLFSFGAYPFLRSMKHDESIPDEAVTLEYLADRLWLVGSPSTVTNKIRDLYEMVGGFGTLLWLTYDHSDNKPAYEKSMRLLAEEVMPQLAGLGAG